MKRVGRALVVAATVLGVVAAPGMAEGAGRGGSQARLDAVVAAGAVGALAEVRGERGVWRGAGGVAESGKPGAVPVNGRFRIGSITKTFVATVVLQLVDEERLRLGDSVEDWLPGAVPGGDRITVRQLLDHTSGVYDVLGTLPFPPAPEFFANRWRTWTMAELVQRAVAHSPTFTPPGSAYSYSNTGYLLLGQIIEQVTANAFGDEIEWRILRPLRLRDTSVPGTFPRIRGPHPHGYVPTERGDDPDLIDYTEMNPSVMSAGGEMIATVWGWPGEPSPAASACTATTATR